MRARWAWSLVAPLAVVAVVAVSCGGAIGGGGADGAGHGRWAGPAHRPSAAAGHRPADPADAGHGPAAPAAAHADPVGAYQRLRDRVLAVLDRRGPAAALAALDRAIAADPRAAGVCHAVAHDLGHATVRLLGGDAAAALEVRNDVCGGGYTHGVVELALAGSPDVAGDLLRICAPANDGSCFHGVGHGVVFATRYDVPRSLALCDRAPDARLAVRCGEGVFMQLFTQDDGAGHLAPAGWTPPTPADARARCRDTRYPYSGPCWFYAPTVWLGRHPEDWAGVVAWCAHAPAGLGRQTCVRGVGSRLVKYHPDDLRFGAAVCDAVPGDLLGSCLAGMGSYWSVHWKGRRPPSDVCGRLGDARLGRVCRAVTA